MRVRFALLILLALSGSKLIGSPAGGRVGLDVYPSLLEITLKPGDRFEREVTLSNGGEAPLSVSVEMGDWTLTESGEVRFSQAATLAGSCARWIDVEPPHVLIPPRGRATVKLTVRSPADAAGTRWGVVFFSLPETPGSVQGSPVAYAPRVGLTVYVTAEGTEREDFRLTDVSAAEIPNRKGVRLAAVVKNDGNVAVRFRVTWQAKSADGKYIRSFEVRSVVVLPGARREVTLQAEDEIPPGSYTITGMVRWGSKRWAAKDSPLIVKGVRSIAA